MPTPGDARGSFTVGARDWQGDAAADYSSQGPTEDGRLKPDVVAPASTAVWPGVAMVGTSASAPHAAGAAALLMQRDRAAGQPSDPDTIARELTGERARHRAGRARTRSRVRGASGSISIRRPGSRRRLPPASRSATRRASTSPSTMPARSRPPASRSTASRRRRSPGLLHRRLDTARPRGRPAHRALLGARHGRATAPSWRCRSSATARRRRWRSPSSGNALDVTVADAESRTGSLVVQIDDPTGAVHVQRTLPLTFAPAARGRASPRRLWRAAGSGCGCRRSTRSGTRRAAVTRGWRPGRDEAHAQRCAGPPLARSLLPPAVVLDVSFVNGLEAIRSLAAAGAPVIAVDHRPGALGFRSRLAHHVALARPEGRGGLRRLPGRARRALLLRAGGRVPDPRRAAGGRSRATPRGSPPTSCRAAAGTCSSRCSASATSTRSRRARASASRSRSRPTARPRRAVAAAALSYPAVVKPGDPIPFKRRFGRPVLVCDTPDELLDAWRSAADCEPMLQEVVPGDDATLWTVGSYTDCLRGRARRLLRPQAAADAARLRHLPHRRGALARRRRRPGARAARALGYHGIAQTEFRLDPRDGRFKLMEVNPRLWQWHGLARACGVDLPRIAYFDVLGRPQTRVTQRPRSTTAAAGPSRPRICARRGRRARRCAGRCGRSAPAPSRARSTCATRCRRSCRPRAS